MNEESTVNQSQIPRLCTNLVNKDNSASDCENKTVPNNVVRWTRFDLKE